jgi:hypothetical protein
LNDAKSLKTAKFIEIMIQAQILKDKDGVSMGVFIPINDWEQVKRNYPDVEEITGDLPQWEKDFIDARLEIANKHPERLHPLNQLFQ